MIRDKRDRGAGMARKLILDIPHTLQVKTGGILFFLLFFFSSFLLFLSFLESRIFAESREATIADEGIDLVPEIAGNKSLDLILTYVNRLDCSHHSGQN